MRLPAVLVSLVVVDLLAGAGLGAYALVQQHAPVAAPARAPAAVERTGSVAPGMAGQVREVCRAAVRERLRDPADPTFRGERVLPGDGPTQYVVTGLVDSATGSGGPAQRPYVCSASRDGDDAWRATAYLA